MGKAGGPTGAHSYIGILTVGYMNIGMGCVATHVYLESSTRKGVLQGYKQYTYIKLYKNNRYLQFLLGYVPHSSGYNN